MKGKMIFKQVSDDEFNFYTEHYFFDDDGLKGKDGKNGLIIFGNRDYEGKFFCEDKIKEGVKEIFKEHEFSNRDETINEVLSFLKEKTGKEYKVSQGHGSSQGEFQQFFYPEGEFTYNHIQKIQDMYFGMGYIFKNQEDEVMYSNGYNEDEILKDFMDNGYKAEDIKIMLRDDANNRVIQAYKEIGFNSPMIYDGKQIVPAHYEINFSGDYDNCYPDNIKRKEGNSFKSLKEAKAYIGKHYNELIDEAEGMLGASEEKGDVILLIEKLPDEWKDYYNEKDIEVVFEKQVCNKGKWDKKNPFPMFVKKHDDLIK